MTTIGFQEYPPGAIKTRAQLLDLVIEARKGKKAIRLYAVEQGGSFAELFLTSKSHIEQVSDIGERVHVWEKSRWADKRFYKTHRFFGDVNVVGKDGRHSGYNRHMLFSNRRSAQNYATALKADAPYQQAVAAWHKRCSKLLGDWMA